MQKIPTASGSTTWATATVNSSNSLNANPGYYVSGTSCAVCGGDSYYCTGGTAGRKTVQTGYYSTGGTSSTTRTGETKCEAGNKCVNGVKTACSGTNEWQDGTGQTSCKTVTDGMYKKSNAALQNCGTSYYCKSGARNQCPNSGTTASETSSVIDQCYKSGMSWTVSNGTGTQRCFYTSGSGTSAVYSTNCDTKSITGCNGGYYRANTTDSSCTKVGIGYYSANNALTRSACSDWRANTSTTGETSSSTDSCVCVAGRYLNSSNTCTVCATGTYKGSKGNGACSSADAGYYVDTTGATSQIACAAGTYTSTTGKSSCTDAVAGTYTTGCKDTTNNKACTGTSVCAANTYSDAKASACSACDSDYSNSGTAASDHAGVSSCKVTCPAGKVVSSAGAACSVPSGSWYSAEHVVSQGSTSGSYKKSCLTNYATPNTTTQSDHDSSTDCTITCAAGSRITTANNTSCTAITSGNVYMLEHTVKQGSASAAASSCPSSYSISGTTQADHDAKSDCKISCSAGSAVLKADETCTSIQNATYKGKYIAANTVSAGSTSTIQSCPANYQDGNGTTAENQCINSCAAGSRVASANADCAAITSGNVYMLAHDVKYGSTSAAASSCPSSYSISGTTQADHDAKSDCKISCSAGSAVLKADETCTSIQNATYKGKYIAANTVSAGSTSTIQSCPANYQDGNGTTAENQCINSCAAGTQVVSANADCSTPQGTTWYTSAHDVKYGATSGSNVKSCNSGYATANTTTATDHDSNADCKASCSAGYYVATAGAGCVACPGGKYCNGGTVDQNTPLAISGNVEAGYYSTGGGMSAKGTCIDGEDCGLIKLGLYSTCGATSAGDTGGVLADKDYLDCVSGCECGRVAAGYYSTGGGTSKTPTANGNGCVGNGNTCGMVDPGYYSRGGAGKAKPDTIYCWGYNKYSDGVAGCGKVGAGYYSNGGGTMPNGQCLSGKSCGVVEAGYYATGGATTNTGNGQVEGGYFSTGGATKSKPSEADCVGSGNKCGLIAGGYWSVSGAKTATPKAKTDCIGMGDDHEYCGVISGGYYSTCGATYKLPATLGDCVDGCSCGMIKAGYYSTGCGISDTGDVCSAEYEGNVVPEGYYTTGGAGMSPVAAGYYSTGGGTSATGTCIDGYECGAVDAGYYSTGGGTSSAGTCIEGKSCGLIAAGYYSTGGAKKYEPYLSNSCVDGNTCGLVDGGYYSTGGGVSKTPTANGNGCVGSGKTCGKLSVGYYSNGGATSANATCIEGQTCGECPSDYRGGTLTGKTSESQCQASCAAGTRVVNPNAACTSPAGAWFTAQHLVNYGHISEVKYCMDGFTSNSTSASGHDAKSDCVQTIEGKGVDATTIAARYIKVTSEGIAGNPDTHMVEIQAFTSADATGTNLLSGKDGSTGSRLTTATNGSWTRGGKDTYAQGTDLIWDLGAIQNLGSIKFAMYTDGRVYKNVTIAVSVDNQQYTTVFRTAELKTDNTENPTGELVVLSAVPTDCAAGSYQANTTVALGSVKRCAVADAGYFVGSTGASSQTACKMGSYTSTTGQSACTACAGGKTNGADGSTSCADTCLNSTGVASSGWDTPQWNTDNTVSYLCSIKATAGCSANYYKNSNACATCSSGTNSKYTLSAAGATTVNDCYLEPTATKYVAAAGQGLTTCAENGYCPGSTAANPIKIYYGGTHSSTHLTTGGRTACSGSYTLAASGSDDVNDCYLKTSAGSYVESAGAGQKTCPAGSWCVGNVVIYKGGSVSGRVTSGGSQQCPAGYRDGATGYSLESQCTMNVAYGKYVASVGESVASGTCAKGYAKAEHSVTYGKMSSCDACTGATYADDTGLRACKACPAATNNTSDVVSYAYWNNGKSGDQTTRAGCNVTFKSKTLDDGTMTSYSCYVDSGADTYGVNGTAQACWVDRANLKCNGGYYNTTFNSSSTATQYTNNTKLTDLYANACVDAETGYWSANDSLTRTACATGLTTCGSGKCANEAADCGRKLHAGDKVVHLRSAKRDAPALHVKIGDQTFYGMLGAVVANSLRVKNGSNTYSVVNDNQ